jgi:SAM-dependent methyltransferase
MAGYEWIKNCKVCAGDRFVQLTTAPKVNFYQCEDCLVVFLNPQPTQATLKRQYTRQGLLENGPASAWFKHKKVYLREIYLDRLRDVLRYRSQGDLLDVGCGMGDFCTLAREAGFHVYGTEFSDIYAAHAEKAAGMTGIFVGKLQEIDFGSKRFDVITLWHVFEHLPDPLETLVCLKGLLKPGGLVAIEVPNVEQKRKRPWYLSDIEDYPVDRLEHMFYYSGRSLENACTKAGFTVFKLNFVEAYQPAKNIVKHLLRKVKGPSKRLVYYGRENKGYSALRIFLTGT